MYLSYSRRREFVWVVYIGKGMGCGNSTNQQDYLFEKLCVAYLGLRIICGPRRNDTLRSSRKGFFFLCFGFILLHYRVALSHNLCSVISQASLVTPQKKLFIPLWRTSTCICLNGPATLTFSFFKRFLMYGPAQKDAICRYSDKGLRLFKQVKASALDC